MTHLLCLLSFCIAAEAAPPLQQLADAPTPDMGEAATVMSLLYSNDRVSLTAEGEPKVSVGIVTGEDVLAVQAATPLEITFYRKGRKHTVVSRPGQLLRLKLQQAEAARRRYYVDLGQGGAAASRSGGLDGALKQLRARGLRSVMPLYEGSVIGIGGRVLDNRVYRLVLPAVDGADAVRRKTMVSSQLGIEAHVKEQLDDTPHGILAVELGGNMVGSADNFVRVVNLAGEPIQIGDVEFARGYAWHGRANRRYLGEIYAVVDPEGKLAAINVLGAETLLEGVVPAEIFPNAPFEALKAQAVAARNTLLAKLGKGHVMQPFIVCGEQHCQVYGGVSAQHARTSAAVRATAGEVLFHKQRLVDAVYSSNCGGFTENNDAVWGDAPNAALRGRSDFDLSAQGALRPGLSEQGMVDFLASTSPAFCAAARPGRPEKYRWRKTFQSADLDRLLSKAYPQLGGLLDVEVVGRGSGGRVTALKLLGTRKTVLVRRELPIRQLFDNLNSAAFTVEMTRDVTGLVRQLTFVGAGWGHGVGLCQLGAIGRAQAGQTYRQILAHYYNGAAVQKLYGHHAAAQR